MKKILPLLVCLAACCTAFAQTPANTLPPSTYADSLFFANEWQAAKTAYREYLLKYRKRHNPGFVWLSAKSVRTVRMKPSRAYRN